uniref:Transposase n=1 Tax=Globodera pallida TaxID=36090 RepID=A0A183CNY1_GLOPA
MLSLAEGKEIRQSFNRNVKSMGQGLLLRLRHGFVQQQRMELRRQAVHPRGDNVNNHFHRSAAHPRGDNVNNHFHRSAAHPRGRIAMAMAS